MTREPSLGGHPNNVGDLPNLNKWFSKSTWFNLFSSYVTLFLVFPSVIPSSDELDELEDLDELDDLDVIDSGFLSSLSEVAPLLSIS